MHRSRIPLLGVVAVLIIATGILLSVTHEKNPATPPTGIVVSQNAESTALYCTGLSASTGAQGRVVFYNTANATRDVTVTIVSDTNASVTKSLEIGSHTAQSIQPGTLDTGKSFAVAAQVSGGGVVGDEVLGSNRSEVPCVGTGTKQWYATGFDTTVGSTASLSLYNPTGTAAVLDADVYSAAGYAAPQSFQGLSVPAHSQVEVNLGTQVVNTTNIGVAVHVLRGSLTIVGVQGSNGAVSLTAGSTSLGTSAFYPDVTTVSNATAVLRIANPGPKPANVSVAVSLGDYKIANQKVTINPFTTGVVSITPNSAIPAAGYAALSLHSNVSVISSLATGNGSSIALSAPVSPGGPFLVRNFTGLGFDAATVMNTAKTPISFSVATTVDGTTTAVLTGGTLAGGASESLSTLISAIATSQSQTYVISSSQPSLLVGLSVPSTPKGINVVPPLNGG